MLYGCVVIVVVVVVVIVVVFIIAFHCMACVFPICIYTHGW
jgi:hypothetical protein